MILDVYGILHRYITPFTIYGTHYCICNKSIRAVWLLKAYQDEYLPMNYGDLYFVYKLLKKLDCPCIRHFLVVSIVAYARYKKKRIILEEDASMPRKYNRFIKNFCHVFLNLCEPFASSTYYIMDQIRFGDYGVRLVTANGKLFLDQYQVFSKNLGRDVSYHMSSNVCGRKSTKRPQPYEYRKDRLKIPRFC